jgi:putative ABC transport system ATP-binding protein
MLQTKDLTFSYNAQHQLHFDDIHCKQGEQWLLLGQSGSGKTTLLHLLGGLLSPKKGKVIVGDTDLTTLSEHAKDKFRGKNIGIIFQNAHFIRSLSVEENLMIAQKLAGLKIDKDHIQQLLDRLNVGHKIKAPTKSLSTGEQQRVAIARALVNKPKIILADEPTSALDDVNCGQVIELIEEVANEVGATLLVVTHDARLSSQFSNQINL